MAYSPGFSGAKLTDKQKAAQAKLFSQSTSSNNLTAAKAEYKKTSAEAIAAQKAYDASLTNKDIQVRSANSYTLTAPHTFTITHAYAPDIIPATYVLTTGFTRSLNALYANYTIVSDAVLSIDMGSDVVTKGPTATQGKVIYGTSLVPFANFINLRTIEDASNRLVTANYKNRIAKEALTKATAAAKAAGVTVGGAVVTPVDTPVVPTGSDTSPVTYNIPSVKEAYFSGAASVSDAAGKVFDTVNKNYDKDVLFVDSGNRPIKVAEAQELWNTVGAHKGMFQTFIVPKTSADKNTKGIAASTTATTANSNVANIGRYGFQFLYNPGTINMEYTGSTNIDPGLQMSNQEMIPLIGASNTSSTISFNLVLNRMPDMRHIDSATSESSNLLSEKEYIDVYGHTPPADYNDSLKRIRDTGTMYDVEFLLQTLLGYKAFSSLRGRHTPDIGYIGSFPVELHLGKSLRYIVLVSDISVNHTIFTKDMVPVYTNVSIFAGRLPDTGFNTLLHTYKPPAVATNNPALKPKSNLTPFA